MGDADLDWRPIEPKDAAAWSATLIEIQHADRDWEFLTEQDLLDDFGNPDHDFPRGSMGAFADGAMVAFGTVQVRSQADPVHEMRYWGGVHPAWRQRGLGSRLLDWAEDAAVRLHQEHFPGQPLSLSGSSLTHDPDGGALYAARGYQPVRWFHVMSRDLKAPLPEASLAPDVRVVPFAPGPSARAIEPMSDVTGPPFGAVAPEGGRLYLAGIEPAAGRYPPGADRSDVRYELPPE